jgi:2-phospho-L-lactate guanylyltransferase (CobY/MobA/RfbA family)
VTSSLEAARIARVLPDAEVVTADELGFHDLAKQGMSADEADLETAIRALRRWGIEEAVVPPDLGGCRPSAR